MTRVIMSSCFDVLHVEYPKTVTLITQQQAYHLKDRLFPSRTCSCKMDLVFSNFLNELSPSAGVTGLPCPRNDQSQHDGTNTAHLRRGAAADLHPDAPGLVSALSEFPAVQAGHPAECGPVMTSRSVCSFPTSFDRSRAFLHLSLMMLCASEPTNPRPLFGQTSLTRTAFLFCASRSAASQK